MKMKMMEMMKMKDGEDDEDDDFFTINLFMIDD